ncbi:MAG: epoxyqueuosine reductase [Christensenellaceae bacterium]|jgi:epoxyqueuosine reductase QueG|nr:epoxyqueuosine reductase [Christensenellaceae bacterium]
MEELRSFLQGRGAKLVGFADLREFAQSYPFGVALALPLPKGVLRGIEGGPKRDYFEAYHALNAELDGLALAGEAFLREKGNKAFAQTVERVVESEDYRSEMPHKTVATRAGLGWIGKSALLVTREFGPALRLSSILTDAPLDCAKPSDVSLCGECAACQAGCPAGAILGENWQRCLERKGLVDVFRCREYARALAKERLGEAITLCGKCIAACPYARAYLAG